MCPFTLSYVFDENTNININSSLKREADLILAVKAEPVYGSRKTKKP